MIDLEHAIDPEAVHRRWVSQFTWHIDLLPHLMDALVEATLPTVKVSRFDKDMVTGGGWVDSMKILDQFDVTGDGHVYRTGAAADARELWGWVTGYTAGCSAWLNQYVTAPWAADLPPVGTGSRLDPDPLSARATALVTAGWLIDHADRIYEHPELEAHREAMFHLIRQLRGRYGVFNHPRRARPGTCRTCGERAVVMDWVDAGNGSPKPVKAGKCRKCGETYRAEEQTDGQ